MSLKGRSVILDLRPHQDPSLNIFRALKIIPIIAYMSHQSSLDRVFTYLQAKSMMGMKSRASQGKVNELMGNNG